MSNTALVTGGAGFAGTQLTRALLAEGWKVAVLDDLSTGSRERLPAEVEFAEADVASPSAVEEFIQRTQPEAVFHLAALHFIPACDADPARAFGTNTYGTYNVLNALRRVPPRFLFFASTAAVYPIVETLIPETTPTGPIDIYGRTKAVSEDLCQLFQRDTGAAVAIGRLFNIYGPDDPIPHVIPEIVEQLRTGDGSLALGNMYPQRDYVHVRDVARAIIALSRTVQSGCEVFNIGTGVGTSVTDIVDICSEVLGRRVEVREAAERMRPVERAVLCADTSRIREAAGWEPSIDFRTGLAELLTPSKDRVGSVAQR